MIYKVRLMENLFFDDTNNIWKIIIIAPIIYVMVILYIRILGKRSSSQMNSFDWIVTVAMGSLVSSTIILKDVSLIEGATAIFMLLAMQFIFTKIMVRNKSFRTVIRSTPTLLFYNGDYLEDNLHKERLVKEEVLSAIRQEGIADINDVLAVVLETDAILSVIKKDSNSRGESVLYNVEGCPNR